MTLLTKKYDDNLSDTQAQLKLHDELKRRGKITKAKKLLLDTGVHISNILGSKWLHLIDVGLKRWNQSSLINIAKHAESQFSLAGVNHAEKVKQDQFQWLWMQTANSVGGEQTQMLGWFESAKKIGEDQIQGIGIQVISDMDHKGEESEKWGAKGNQIQWFGMQYASNVQLQDQFIGGVQSVTGKSLWQSQWIGVQTGKNTVYQEQLWGVQVGKNVTEQKQGIGFQWATKNTPFRWKQTQTLWFQYRQENFK